MKKKIGALVALAIISHGFLAVFLSAKNLYPLTNSNLSTNAMKQVFDYLVPDKKDWQPQAMTLSTYKAALEGGQNLAITLFKFSQGQNDQVYLITTKPTTNGQVEILNSIYLNKVAHVNFENTLELYPSLVKLGQDDYGVLFIQSQHSNKIDTALSVSHAQLISLTKSGAPLASLPFGCLYQSNQCPGVKAKTGNTCSTFNVVEASLTDLGEGKNGFVVHYKGTKSQKINEIFHPKSSEETVAYNISPQGKSQASRTWKNNICPAALK